MLRHGKKPRIACHATKLDGYHFAQVDRFARVRHAPRGASAGFMIRKKLKPLDCCFEIRNFMTPEKALSVTLVAANEYRCAFLHLSKEWASTSNQIDPFKHLHNVLSTRLAIVRKLA